MEHDADDSDNKRRIWNNNMRNVSFGNKENQWNSPRTNEQLLSSSIIVIYVSKSQIIIE